MVSSRAHTAIWPHQEQCLLTRGGSSANGWLELAKGFISRDCIGEGYVTSTSAGPFVEMLPRHRVVEMRRCSPCGELEWIAITWGYNRNSFTQRFLLPFRLNLGLTNVNGVVSVVNTGAGSASMQQWEERAFYTRTTATPCLRSHRATRCVLLIVMRKPVLI